MHTLLMITPLAEFTSVLVHIPAFIQYNPLRAMTLRYPSEPYDALHVAIVIHNFEVTLFSTSPNAQVV